MTYLDGPAIIVIIISTKGGMFRVFEDSDAGKIEGKRRSGQQRMRWSDGINGREFEQALGDSGGQGSLACYCPRGHR